MSSYNYIVVGAGSAGCAAASRGSVQLNAASVMIGERCAAFLDRGAI